MTSLPPSQPPPPPPPHHHANQPNSALSSTNAAAANYGRLPEHLTAPSPTTNNTVAGSAVGNPSTEYMSGFDALGVSVLNAPSADDNICVECNINRAQRPRVVCMPCVEEARRRSTMQSTSSDDISNTSNNASTSNNINNHMPEVITVFRAGLGSGNSNAAPVRMVLPVSHNNSVSSNSVSNGGSVNSPSVLLPGVIGAGSGSSFDDMIEDDEEIDPPPPDDTSSSSSYSRPSSRAPPPFVAPKAATFIVAKSRPGGAAATASTLFVGDAPMNVPTVWASSRNPQPLAHGLPRAMVVVDDSALLQNQRARGTTNFGQLREDSPSLPPPPPVGARASRGFVDSDDENDPPPPPAPTDAGEYVSTALLLGAQPPVAVYSDFVPLAAAAAGSGGAAPHPQEYLAITPQEDLAPATRRTISRGGLVAPAAARGASTTHTPSPLAAPSSPGPTRPAPPRRGGSRAPPPALHSVSPPATANNASLLRGAPAARRDRGNNGPSPGAAQSAPKKRSFILSEPVSRLRGAEGPMLTRRTSDVADIGSLSRDSEADPPPPPPDSPTLNAPPVRRRPPVTYENLPRSQTYVQLGPEGIQPIPPSAPPSGAAATQTSNVAIASLPRKAPTAVAAPPASSHYGSVSVAAASPLMYVSLSAKEQIVGRAK